MENENRLSEIAANNINNPTIQLNSIAWLNEIKAIPAKLITPPSQPFNFIFHSKTEAKIAVTIGVTEMIKLADPAFTVFRRSLMRCDK